MTLHATDMEWLFFIVAVISLVLSIWSEREASLDAAALIALHVNGARRATAQANIRECYFGIAGSMIMMLASSLALILPPPPPDYSMVPQTSAFLLAYILLSIVTVTNQLLSKSARRRLNRMSPQEHVETTYVTESPDSAREHGRKPEVLTGRRFNDHTNESKDGPKS